MKKYPIDGQKLKRLRQERDRGATQKELAHSVGLSERHLRQLENSDGAVTHDILQKLARELSVQPQELSRENVVLLVPSAAPPSIKKEPELMPRFSDFFAEAAKDEVALCDQAVYTHVVLTYFRVSLSEETGRYAERLIELLTSVTLDRPSGMELREGLSELDWRRQVRQCIVLLRGNDVWVYWLDNIKRLPESNEVQPLSNRHHQWQLILVFGAPGVNGETKVEVRVDHGQPSIFSWDW